MVRRSAQRRIFNLRSSNNDQDPWMSSNYAKCTHMFSPRVSLSPVPVELINFPRFCVICRGILARISQEFLSDFCVSAKLTSPSCNSSCLVRPDAMRGGRGQARTACSCHHLLCHHHCHLLSTSFIANCSLVILMKIKEVQHHVFVLRRLFLVEALVSILQGRCTTTN